MNYGTRFLRDSGEVTCMFSHPLTFLTIPSRNNPAALPGLYTQRHAWLTDGLEECDVFVAIRPRSVASVTTLRKKKDGTLHLCSDSPPSVPH